VPLFVITASIAWAVNSAWLYARGFDKYDVRASLAEAGLPVTRSDLNGIAREFVRYFNSGEEYINLTVNVDGRTVELFNREEILHFKDVKGLFRLDYAVVGGTLLYGVVFIAVALLWRRGKHRRMLAKTLTIGAGVGLGLLLLLAIGTFFDFDQLFYGFHLISFSNQYWSAEGNMLLLFPGGFWYDMVIAVWLFGAGLAAVTGGISAACLFARRRRKSASP
jgi:integral membrane protein (TIGR01906 family)